MQHIYLAGRVTGDNFAGSDNFKVVQLYGTIHHAFTGSGHFTGYTLVFRTANAKVIDRIELEVDNVEDAIVRLDLVAKMGFREAANA